MHCRAALQRADHADEAEQLTLAKPDPTAFCQAWIGLAPCYALGNRMRARLAEQLAEQWAQVQSVDRRAHAAAKATAAGKAAAGYLQPSSRWSQPGLGRLGFCWVEEDLVA